MQTYPLSIVKVVYNSSRLYGCPTNSISSYFSQHQTVLHNMVFRLWQHLPHKQLFQNQNKPQNGKPTTIGMQIKSIIRLAHRPCYTATRYVAQTSNATNVTTPTSKDVIESEERRSKLKMKGWQIHGYGDIEELQLSDKLKIPQIRQADQCLVKVLSTTVNPIDVAMLNGYGSTIMNVMRCQRNSIEFPLTFGREFCGVLVQKGMNVCDFKLPLGQRVWGVVPVQLPQGSHAEYVAVPQYCISPAPTNLSNEEVASVLYAGLTAWSGLYITANLGGICGALVGEGGSNHKRILILGGSGSVGSIAIQMLKAQGSQVVATCSENARELVQSLGADFVIDYTNPVEMETLRSYAPYDVVLDCSGQGPQGADVLNFKYHQYVTFSSPLLKNIDNSGLGLGVLKNITNLLETNVKSVMQQNGLVKWGFFTPAPQGINLLKQLVERKKLLPLIENTYKFEQMPEAFNRVKSGHLRGKVVVNIN